MTAEVIEFRPRADDVNDTIRASVRALMKGRALSTEQLASLSGMASSTLYKRLAGKGSQQAFAAGELGVIAAVLNVEVGRLYDGLGGTFGPGPDDGPAAAGGRGKAARTQPAD